MRDSRAYQCGAIVVALVTAGVATVLTLNAVDQERSRSRLQSMAEDAAISAVRALASDAAKGGNVADDAAVKAAADEITHKVEGGAHVQVQPSSIDSSVAVEISAPSRSWLLGFQHGGAPIDVIAHATYEGPAQKQGPSANRLRGWRSYAQSN